MNRNARRVKALKRVARQPAGNTEQLPEKDVYGADARSEKAHRPYATFDGVDAHRPMIMGFRPNEERR